MKGQLIATRRLHKYFAPQLYTYVANPQHDFDIFSTNMTFSRNLLGECSLFRWTGKEVVRCCKSLRGRFQCTCERRFKDARFNSISLRYMAGAQFFGAVAMENAANVKLLYFHSSHNVLLQILRDLKENSTSCDRYKKASAIYRCLYEIYFHKLTLEIEKQGTLRKQQNHS